MNEVGAQAAPPFTFGASAPSMPNTRNKKKAIPQKDRAQPSSDYLGDSNGISPHTQTNLKEENERKTATNSSEGVDVTQPMSFTQEQRANIDKGPMRPSKVSQHTNLESDYGASRNSATSPDTSPHRMQQQQKLYEDARLRANREAALEWLDRAKSAAQSGEMERAEKMVRRATTLCPDLSFSEIHANIWGSGSDSRQGQGGVPATASHTSTSSPSTSSHTEVERDTSAATISKKSGGAAKADAGKVHNPTNFPASKSGTEGTPYTSTEPDRGPSSSKGHGKAASSTGTTEPTRQSSNTTYQSSPKERYDPRAKDTRTESSGPSGPGTQSSKEREGARNRSESYAEGASSSGRSGFRFSTGSVPDPAQTRGPQTHAGAQQKPQQQQQQEQQQSSRDKESSTNADNQEPAQEEKFTGHDYLQQVEKFFSWLYSRCEGMGTLGLVLHVGAYVTHIVVAFLVIFVFGLWHIVMLWVFWSVAMAVGLRSARRFRAAWHRSLALRAIVGGACYILTLGALYWSLFASPLTYFFYVLLRAIFWAPSIFSHAPAAMLLYRFCRSTDPPWPYSYTLPIAAYFSGNGLWSYAGLLVQLFTMGIIQKDAILLSAVGVPICCQILSRSKWYVSLTFVPICGVAYLYFLSKYARNSSSGSGSSERRSSGKSAGGREYRARPGSSFNDGIGAFSVPKDATGEVRRVLESQDLYEVLSVAKDADVDTLRQARKVMNLATHPDKLRAADGAQAAGANEAFGRVTKAWEVLSDSSKRREYDDELKRAEAAAARAEEMANQGSEDGANGDHDKSCPCCNGSMSPGFVVPCRSCGKDHEFDLTKRPASRARKCAACSTYHSAKDGDLWLETSGTFFHRRNVYFCLQGLVFDVTEWAICGGMVQHWDGSYIEANSHDVWVTMRMSSANRGGGGGRRGSGTAQPPPQAPQPAKANKKKTKKGHGRK